MALSLLESLAGGLFPHNLYLMLCLSTGGQSHNKTVPKSERIWINHAVAGLEVEPGEFLLIDLQ